MIYIDITGVSVKIYPEVLNSPDDCQCLQFRNSIVNFIRLESSACKTNGSDCPILLLLRKCSSVDCGPTINSSLAKGYKSLIVGGKA